MTTIRHDANRCWHRYAEVRGLDRWHCVLCGQQWHPERTVRRGLLWIAAACVVVLYALGGGVDSWAALVAEIAG